jgi:type IV conjugative transfer system lipoprotein TraV
MKRLIALLFGVTVVGALLAGCAGGVSAYGGESTFNCAAKFEVGMPCNSISGTATNYSAGTLKWQQTDSMPGNASMTLAKMQAIGAQPPVLGTGGPAVASGPALERLSPRQMPTPNAGMPLRIPERVLRIWVAPFEDEEGALNDQKYVYLTVQKGGWQVETNKLNTQGGGYKQIYPLGKGKLAEPELVDQRATAKAQAQSAISNNSNITNLPGQPRGARAALAEAGDE